MPPLTPAERSGPVDAVVFDWGGTLTPWHTVDVAQQWRVYARSHPGHGHEVDALADRLAAAFDASWRRGRDVSASARLTEVLAEAGALLDHPGHGCAQAAYESFWEPHTVLDPDVPDLWRGLRDRGVAVGVLSNTLWTRDYHRALFARDGVLDLLDGDVYSSEIGYVKPHPDAFAAALDAVGADDPARVVYVGDRPYEDVHGAQRAGMRAVLVPHSDIPAREQVPVDVVPDAVVHRLSEVLAVVDRWRGV